VWRSVLLFLPSPASSLCHPQTHPARLQDRRWNTAAEAGDGDASGEKVTYSPDQLDNIAIVPLAFPPTCGTGTITAVILLASEAQGIFETALVYAAVGITVGISHLGMQNASRILAIFGEYEIRVLVRLLSIVVLAIGVQFLINGIREALPHIMSYLP
jgi:small neutral amino acid transporter SnatA (MarC family)